MTENTIVMVINTMIREAIEQMSWEYQFANTYFRDGYIAALEQLKAHIRPGKQFEIFLVYETLGENFMQGREEIRSDRVTIRKKGIDE